MKLWITRDESNRLTIHLKKPTKYIYNEYWNNGLCCLPNDLFPEVTFKNSPQQIELKLVKNGKNRW